MQPMDSQELDSRINTFLMRKHEEFPELKLRRKEPKHRKAWGVSELFSDLIAGAKWEFGR